MLRRRGIVIAPGEFSMRKEVPASPRGAQRPPRPAPKMFANHQL